MINDDKFSGADLGEWLDLVRTWKTFCLCSRRQLEQDPEAPALVGHYHANGLGARIRSGCLLFVSRVTRWG